MCVIVADFTTIVQTVHDIVFAKWRFSAVLGFLKFNFLTAGRVKTANMRLDPKFRGVLGKSLLRYGNLLI